MTLRPWTEKLAAEDPAKFIKRAVWLIEKRIHDDFGARIRMGAELEFTVDPPIPKTHPLSRAQSSPSAPNADFYLPAHDKLTAAHEDAPGYETSPHITVLHTIPSKPGAPRQFELIFSHLAPYGNTEQGHLINLARAITTEKKRLHADPQLNAVSFAPTGAGKTTSGLHLNVSLTDANGNALLGRRRDASDVTHFIPTTRTRSILNGINCMQREGQYVLGRTPAHFERLNRLSPKLYFPTNGLRHETLMRIENRTPAADSDPATAILLTLAGIYDGLAHHATSQTVPETRDLSLPHDAATARDTFTHSASLIPLLNKLEPELGDRLRSAILVPSKQAAR